MLLRKIILENYGVFSGRKEFDLIPRIKYKSKRPIILFGGKNGTGKTSILDAIRLVLYGKASLGNRVSQKDYNFFLKNHIHRSTDNLIQPTFSSVAAEFDYAIRGESKTYYVERSWMLSGNNELKEYLKIHENGEIIDEVTPDFWRGFIEEIIPERLSQLFFFDGEKIQSIAEDDGGSRVLADSIKTLLGLDIIERLKADLTIYATREAKKVTAADDKKAWQDTEKKISQVKQEIEQKLNDLAHIRTAIDGIHADIRKRENRLYSEGHNFAVKRDKLKNDTLNLTTIIEDFEGQIRAECEKTYPFALCPVISGLLREQLQKEHDLKRCSVIRDELEGLQNKILDAISSPQIKIGNSTKQKITQVIQTTFKQRVDLANQLKDIKEIHRFSEAESQQIFKWLNDAEEWSKSRIQKISKRLNCTLTELQRISKELTKSPNEAQVQPIFDELSLLNQRLGEFQQKNKQFQDDIRKKEFALKSLQRELKKHIDREMARDTTKSRLRPVKNIQAALDIYLKKLTTKKIAQLRESVAERFNSLSRKGDIIKKIEIAPETFTVTLYDHIGKAIPKESLSSGEKQLYAIAMLWGLAKTSGRPLPFIIDTPLGRLDSDHRRNLINNYFPHASHQVILLSTDTEVDQQLYRELSPNISHCYHLKYDKEYRSTKPKEEYFWKESRSCPN